MKFLFIFLLTLLFLNACASKKTADTPQKALIKENVTATINTHKDDVESCYDSYLKIKPSAHGKMFIDWTISNLGEVSDIKLIKNPFKDETVFNCIAKHLKSWKFSSNLQNGKDVLISYPFHFNVHTL